MSEISEWIRECPELEFYLDRPVREQLEIPDDRPFESDEAYWRLQWAICYLQQVLLYLGQIAGGVPGTLMQTSPGFNDRLFTKPIDDPDASRRTAALLSALRRAAAVLEAKSAARTAAATRREQIPRLVRLAGEMAWTPGELRCIQVMVLCYVDPVTFNKHELRFLIGLAGLSTREFLQFVQPGRRHMKESLVEIEKGISHSVFDHDFRMADEVVKALVGGKLSDDEFLKIDKTALAQVLMAEADFNLAAFAVAAGAVTATGEAPADATGEEAVADPAADEPEEPPEEADLDGDAPPEPGAPVLAADWGGETAPAGNGTELEPYRADLEYLQDQFELVALKIKARKLQLENDPFRSSKERSPEMVLRELAAMERLQSRRIELRLSLTRKAGAWLPRLEQLAANRGLAWFEKHVLLTMVGVNISQEVVKALDSSYGSVEVRDLLYLWSGSLAERIDNRRYFYKNAKLVSEGMIFIESSIRRELGRADVEIDRRMLDYLVGLDTEASELVDGSHLYLPTVRLDQVVLPPVQKKLIVDTVENFNTFQSARRNLGFDDLLSYGKGMVMLFFGQPGTGKTMMANALARHVGKKVLLINFPSLGGQVADEVARLIFREAKIQDALLFFDECESLFEKRESGKPDTGLLLTEMERHDGLVIMATNRPFDLDEAMHRRITLAVEFLSPDQHLREAIWRNHIPESIRPGEGLDLVGLASKYELTGGFIKNAVLTALSIAVAREGAMPRIRQEDLEQGARLQLRTRLRMAELERCEAPTAGFEALVLPERQMKLLREIIQFEKARKVLASQWGFNGHMTHGNGTAVLFQGPPGTGKSLAAEAIAYEIGQPLQVVNTAELISKWVGDTPKNIEMLFKESRGGGSVLVFEEADGLFGQRSAVGSATDRYANIDVGLLLYHIERYPGLVVLTTNLLENIDEAFLRRLKFVLEFPPPDRELRRRLWRQLIPARTPLAPDVDFEALASAYELTGGHIRNAVYRAAARAALRPEAERFIAQADLVEAAQEESGNRRTRRIGF